MSKLKDTSQLKQEIYFVGLRRSKAKFITHDITIDTDTKNISPNTTLNTNHKSILHSKSVSLNTHAESINRSNSLPRLKDLSQFSAIEYSRDVIKERPSVELKRLPELPILSKIKRKLRRIDSDTIRRNGVKSISKIQLQVHSYRTQKMKKWRGYQDYLFLRDAEKVFYMVDKDLQELFGHKLDHKQKSLLYTELDVNVRKRVVMEKIVTDLSQCALYYKDDMIAQLDELLTEVISNLRLYKVGNLFMLGMFVHCLILENYGMWKQSVMAWKRLVNFCNAYKVYKYKIIAYKYMVRNCCNLKQYPHALNYARKLLKYCWLYNLNEYEIESYDQIALIYYYERNLDLARGFHDRFMSGYVEPKQNNLRVANEQMTHFKLAQKEDRNDINSSSDEEMNLNQLMQERPQNEAAKAANHRMATMSIFDQAIDQKKHIMKVLVHYQKDTQSYSKAKIHQYLRKITQPLGPVVRESSLYDNKLNRKQDLQFFSTEQYQQLSLNRDAREFLIARENVNKYSNDSTFVYRPQEGKGLLQNLIQLFIQDIEEFHRYGKFSDY